MNPSNNSSDFLFQSGGGLQSGGAPQGATSGGVQNNGNPLFAGSSGTGQQDILGQATVVGPVNFDTTTGQRSTQPDAESELGVSDFADPIILLIVLAVVLIFGFMFEKIIRLRD